MNPTEQKRRAPAAVMRCWRQSPKHQYRAGQVALNPIRSVRLNAAKPGKTKEEQTRYGSCSCLPWRSHVHHSRPASWTTGVCRLRGRMDTVDLTVKQGPTQQQQPRMPWPLTRTSTLPKSRHRGGLHKDEIRDIPPASKCSGGRSPRQTGRERSYNIGLSFPG
jgi:hypothetical protein